MCCSPAGCQLHQLISALQDKEGQRSSLGRPPVGEREQPVARPCLLQGTPAPYQGWRQSQAGGPGLETQQLGLILSSVTCQLCDFCALIFQL